MRQLDRGFQRVGGVADLVVPLVIGLEATQDLDRILDGRLVDVDLLEAADQCSVLLEIIAVLLVGRRPDTADDAAGKCGLEQIRGVHRSAAGGAGADDGVDLVDEEDRPGLRFELGQHRLQSLLEIAAVARSGEQRAHVEGIDRRVREHLGNLALHDPARQPLGDGGFADPGVADIKRVVFRAPTQDLDRALDLRLAPDQRVDAAAFCLFVQIDTVGVERVVAALLRLVGAALVLVRPLDSPGFRASRRLGDAVRDVVDRIEPGHVLFLQEINRVAFPLGEHRDQHIGTGHLLPAGGLDVDRGTLQNALKARRRLGVVLVGRNEVAEFVVDIGQHFAAQPFELDAAGAQHRDRVLILGQCQQQMLERGIFMPPVIRVGERPVKRFFEIA